MRKRFYLSSLFLLTAATAVLLAIWRVTRPDDFILYAYALLWLALFVRAIRANRRRRLIRLGRIAQQRIEICGPTVHNVGEQVDLLASRGTTVEPKDSV